MSPNAVRCPVPALSSLVALQSPDLKQFRAQYALSRRVCWTTMLQSTFNAGTAGAALVTAGARSTGDECYKKDLSSYTIETSEFKFLKMLFTIICTRSFLWNSKLSERCVKNTSLQLNARLKVDCEGTAKYFLPKLTKNAQRF